MEPRRGWRGWTLALALALAFSAGARSPHDVSDDPGIEEATRAIVEHAGIRRLILLGEAHGTREIPDLVQALTASYANDGPVLLGLEIPYDEQVSLDAYMRSGGDEPARSALRGRAFWSKHDDQHDGRRSEDMLDLIEAVRRLRGEGRDVALLAYDIDADAPRVDANARDRFMADVVRAAYRALPQGRLLVLGGNVHSMLERPAFAPPEMQRPMGSYLRDLSPVSVYIGAREGRYWGCRRGRCQALPAGDFPGGDRELDGAYTFGVALTRFSIARLIGASRSP